MTQKMGKGPAVSTSLVAFHLGCPEPAPSCPGTRLVCFKATWSYHDKELPLYHASGFQEEEKNALFVFAKLLPLNFILLWCLKYPGRNNDED